ncbi:unnamed protein product, partial [Leptidea sinapis]
LVVIYSPLTNSSIQFPFHIGLSLVQGALTTPTSVQLSTRERPGSGAPLFIRPSEPTGI